MSFKSLYLKTDLSQIIGGTQIDNRINKHHILEYKFENTRNLNFFTNIYHLQAFSLKSGHFLHVIVIVTTRGDVTERYLTLPNVIYRYINVT